MTTPQPSPAHPRFADPLFHVVLREPEIPNNTGNIGRTCVAAACALHLIHPLGFEISEKACRRAGLDYWPRLDVREHRDWNEYARTLQPLPEAWAGESPASERLPEGGAGEGPPPEINTRPLNTKDTPSPTFLSGRGSLSRPPDIWLFTTKSPRLIFDAPLHRGDHLVFGKETAGLPDDLLAKHPDRCLTLPMAIGERSLNLATAVCAVVYEGIRQLLARRELTLDASSRLILTPHREP